MPSRVKCALSRLETEKSRKVVVLPLPSTQKMSSNVGEKFISLLSCENFDLESRQIQKKPRKIRKIPLPIEREKIVFVSCFSAIDFL
jgi:hypothetical protein